MESGFESRLRHCSFRVYVAPYPSIVTMPLPAICEWP